MPETNSDKRSRVNRDLARVATDRMSAAMWSVLQLTETPEDAYIVAVCAFFPLLGMITGMKAAMDGLPPDVGNPRKMMTDALDVIFEAAGAPQETRQ